MAGAAADVPIGSRDLAHAATALAHQVWIEAREPAAASRSCARCRRSGVDILARARAALNFDNDALADHRLRIGKQLSGLTAAVMLPFATLRLLGAVDDGATPSAQDATGSRWRPRRERAENRLIGPHPACSPGLPARPLLNRNWRHLR